MNQFNSKRCFFIAVFVSHLNSHKSCIKPSVFSSTKTGSWKSSFYNSAVFPSSDFPMRWMHPVSGHWALMLAAAAAAAEGGGRGGAGCEGWGEVLGASMSPLIRKDHQTGNDTVQWSDHRPTEPGLQRAPSLLTRDVVVDPQSTSDPDTCCVDARHGLDRCSPRGCHLIRRLWWEERFTRHQLMIF